MKLKVFITAVLIAAMGLMIPPSVFSQPSRTGGYKPGYWQPQAQVDPKSRIRVTIQNETGLSVNYGLLPLGTFRRPLPLPPGGTIDLYVNGISSPSNIVNINIYNPEKLMFDYNTNPAENRLFIRIRQSNEPNRYDRSVYIDERGRVYSF